MQCASLTPAFVARALSLPISQTSSRVADSPFSKGVSDSRKVERDCLFIALKGEKFDGHDFISSAITQGAKGILCKKGTPKTSQNTIYFEVDDPQSAFRVLSGAWRDQFSIPIVAVIGSVGKTTTKEMLAAVLSGHFKSVLKTEGSQNGFLGIPMTLLGLRPSHEAAVIEIGIDEIGAMKQHVELVKPTAAALTAIAPEHLEKLRDLETVAQEEWVAIDWVVRRGGAVSVNFDDLRIASLSKNLIRKIGPDLIFGFSLENASAQIHGKVSRENLEIQGTRACDGLYKLPLQGKHNASNFLAAIGIADPLGLTRHEIERGLSLFEGAEGRSQIRTLPDGTKVVCDYYNANPASIAAGLELLNQISPQKTGTKRWICLGDMLELGNEEEQFHRELAKPIMKMGFEGIFLLGPKMKWLHSELVHFGIECHHFEKAEALKIALENQRKPQEAILIKGSRGMKMEEIWNFLNCPKLS